MVFSAPQKEGNTLPLYDDYYIKSICPSVPFRGLWPRASPRATKCILHVMGSKTREVVWEMGVLL